MKTLEIDRPSSPAALYFGALRSGGKPNRRVDSLPEIRLVRPEVTLAPAAIKAYARLCGFSAAQGVPVTYPQLLTFPLFMEYFRSADCPWPALGIVHLANHIRQSQSLAVGDLVRVEIATGQLFAHEKGQVFTLDLTIARDGVPVWQATQTLLRLGVENPAGPPYQSQLTGAVPVSRQADIPAASGIGRTFGRVSGDINPIHLSRLSAMLFGFKRAIAHGLWTKARALSIVLPDHPVATADVLVEFKTPLFLPATASLWTAPDGSGRAFEVRDRAGVKPHLRGHLALSSPP